MVRLKNDLRFIEICEAIEEEVLGNPDDLGVEDLTGDFDNRYGMFYTNGSRKWA